MRTQKVVLIVDSEEDFDLITAASAVESEVFSGLAGAEIWCGNELPESIQLMPPGRHTVTAKKNGKPAEVTVVVDAASAEAFKADFEALLAASMAGKGPKPYLDFNHEDRDAAAWPIEVFWAGEDPKTGGIRAKVEWSKPGMEAIQGKSYRQFSPVFRVSRKTGLIVGTGPNMGGLVNRPAFESIEAFFARDGAKDHGTATRKDPQMKKLQEALRKAGLLTTDHAEDEAAAVIEFQARWGEVQSKVKTADTMASDVVTAKKATDAARADADSWKAKFEKMAEAHADTVVASFVELGLIAPKNEKAKSDLKARLIADPSIEDLFADQVTAKKADIAAGKGKDITRFVVGKQDKREGADAGNSDDHPFLVLAKKIQVDKKVTEEESLNIAARENYELYTSFVAREQVDA